MCGVAIKSSYDDHDPDEDSQNLGLISVRQQEQCHHNQQNNPNTNPFIFYDAAPLEKVDSHGDNK